MEGRIAPLDELGPADLSHRLLAVLERIRRLSVLRIFSVTICTLDSFLPSARILASDLEMIGARFVLRGSLPAHWTWRVLGLGVRHAHPHAYVDISPLSWRHAGEFCRRAGQSLDQRTAR